MLRVAMISPLPPHNSGESTYTRKLIEKLVETGKVKVIAIAQRNAELLEKELTNVETHPVWKNTDPFYPFTLLRYIKKLNVDLVHIQFGPHGKVYGGKFGEYMLLLLLLLRLSGIPTTTTLHSTWMPSQVVRRISDYHGLNSIAIFAPSLFRLYNRFLTKGSTSIQLSTSKMDSLLRKEFLREYNVSQHKIFEIPHPCGKPDSIPETEYALEKLNLEKRKVILVFGFIRREKGIENALEAMRFVKEKIPESVLLIAGRPKDENGLAYLKELKRLCKTYSLENNVRFDTEFIDEENIPNYFGSASVILAPYTESVGASGPIHNSAGYGIPIIASDVGYHMKESIGGNLVLWRKYTPSKLNM